MCKGVIVCVVILLVSGCGKRRELQPATFAADDSSYVLAIVLDLSGSFQQLMAQDGKAYEFLLLLVDRYFRDRIGTNDKIIISQISGDQRALLFEGRPIDLRAQFPFPEAFRDFLLARSDPRASYVHQAIANTLEYITASPSIANGKAKSALFVLSDLADNDPRSEESKARVLKDLSNFAQLGGIAGFYYVDQSLVFTWKRYLSEAGIREFCVESEIVGKPALPSFDD